MAFDKIESAEEILGTETLAETVDSVLAEDLHMRQRRRLIELAFTPGNLALDEPEVMSGAWR